MTTDFSETTDPTATERAQSAASTATDQTKHVAGTTADEARSVASEARDQVRDLAGQTMSDVQEQVEDQSRQQKDKLAGTLSTFSSDLGSMAESGSGLAATLAHELADRAQTLSSHLEGREPQELLDDVRRFARDRPGTFLLGALAAGVIVGRLARSTKDAVEASDAGLGTSATPTTPSTLPTSGAETGFATQPATPPTQRNEPFAPGATTTPVAPLTPAVTSDPYAGPTV